MSTPLLAAPGTLIGSRKSSREILALGRDRGLGEDGYPGFGARAKQHSMCWEHSGKQNRNSPLRARHLLRGRSWYIMVH